MKTIIEKNNEVIKYKFTQDSVTRIVEYKLAEHSNSEIEIEKFADIEYSNWLKWLN